MELLTWVLFFAFGLLLQVFPHVVIPSYLAIKTVKYFLPAYRGIPIPLIQWYDIVFMSIMTITLRLLIFHFGVEINMQFLEIPTWAPWVPEDLHHMYHHFRYPLPIAVFIARIISALYFGRRCQKDNGPIK